MIGTAAALVAPLAGGSRHVENGLIVFDRNVKGIAQLFTVDPSGKSLRRLTTTSGQSGKWSPDGRRIAFVTSGPALAVMDANGAHARTLVSRKGLLPYQLAWSPDGRMVAFTACHMNKFGCSSYDLDVVAATGSGFRRLATTVFATSTPAWSPNSRRIAFATNSPNYVNVVSVSGSKPTRLISIPSKDPSWSPDGRSLAFSGLARGGGTYDLYIAASTGANLIDTGQDGSYPQWSHDGRWIAFTSVPSGGTGQLWVAAADGRGARMIPTPVAPTNWVWSPDGRMFAVFGPTSASGSLWSVPMGPGAPHRLSASAAASPDWQLR
jgi:TolB protein